MYFSGIICVIFLLSHYLFLPLSPITTPPPQTGSIDLTIDPEGGHYSSDRIPASSGTYEGQLVVGDSFINPVKKFTVRVESEQIVVLEFEVGADRGFATGGMVLCTVCMSAPL